MPARKAEPPNEEAVNMPQSVFETLNAINVNEHTEKKNGLTYLSWAWAWAELLKKYPDSMYTIYENKDGLFYHTDGKTAWVKTGVTVEGKEYIEFLPVMDYKNRSIPIDQITSFDVNKAIQRSLTKAVARHGLGLYIYAGEDLPEEEPEPRHTNDTADAVAKIDNVIRSMTKEMTNDQKREFANTYIKPIIGSFNYKSCTDITKLKQLMDKLNAA